MVFRVSVSLFSCLLRENDLYSCYCCMVNVVVDSIFAINQVFSAHLQVELQFYASIHV